MKLRVRTLILSDLHLGTPDCKIDEVNHLLDKIHCEKLILNGDIIDGWQLQRGSKWTKDHTHFVRAVLKKIEKRDTEVIYVRGNHDEILASFLPFSFGNLFLVEDHVHQAIDGKRYLVLHGDVFDVITKKFVWLAHLGDWGYTTLLVMNRLYNKWRAWRGLEYWSLSSAIKMKVKEAVNHVSNFEGHLARLAEERGCHGVICGHIHTSADKYIDETHYLNSGDWVESMTAITENYRGEFEVVKFRDFKKDYPTKK